MLRTGKACVLGCCFRLRSKATPRRYVALAGRINSHLASFSHVSLTRVSAPLRLQRKARIKHGTLGREKKSEEGCMPKKGYRVEKNADACWRKAFGRLTYWILYLEWSKWLSNLRLPWNPADWLSSNATFTNSNSLNRKTSNLHLKQTGLLSDLKAAETNTRIQKYFIYPERKIKCCPSVLNKSMWMQSVLQQIWLKAFC